MSRTPHPPAVADRDLPVLLAVYGTLRRGCRNHHVLAGSEHVRDGAVAGVLHEIVVPLRLDYSYPLLVVPSPGADVPRADHPRADGPRVVVEVYRVTDPQVLARLDVLEAYDPDHPGTSEYVRARVPLLGRDGADAHDGLDEPDRQVQTYVYAGAVAEQGPVLPGGDWCTHKGALG
ncbi:gamma-glutamylcyclotransferase family protein [Aquipuribacter sp. MA13-6]|uniref:gamma-glutamylcyclotransferase family protein n=1 Tax=unclassified Aquipuribacter TaxID=2635084 RepID=UPI003EEFB982